MVPNNSQMVQNDSLMVQNDFQMLPNGSDYLQIHKSRLQYKMYNDLFHDLRGDTKPEIRETNNINSADESDKKEAAEK